jgi:hypothetical protein
VHHTAMGHSLPMRLVPRLARCPEYPVVSTGRRNTLSWKEKMECVARDQRFRRGFTAAEKAEL